MLLRRSTTITAGAALVGCALLAPTAAQAAERTAPAAVSPSASLTTWGSSSYYGSGQFVITNDTDTPRDWALRFTVPNGEYQNHSDWNVRADVRGDQVTLTPKGGTLAPGMSEYVSFGIAGDGSSDLVVEGCDLDGTAVAGCSADTEEPGAPAAPTDVRVNEPTSDSAVVTWTNLHKDDVIGYDVSVYQGDRLLRSQPVSGPDTVSALVGRLDADTEYGVEVAALTVHGQSAPTERVTFRTAVDAPSAPATPTDVRVNEPASDSAVVTWTNLDQRGVIGYQVDVYQGDRLVRQQPVSGPDTVSALIGRLDADTEYGVEVSAVSPEEQSAPTERVTFRTAG